MRSEEELKKILEELREDLKQETIAHRITLTRLVISTILYVMGVEPEDTGPMIDNLQ